MWKEIVAKHFENYEKYANVLCGQNTEYLIAGTYNNHCDIKD
jgi:hypothetical protein